ncbi:hypothetical protein PACTADRAFT_48341 [Pachysolen tannophilus NRRL Y-2460]|uniref:Transcription initiation factor TFIID subunit 10 n=1 Tax=Pachysolen tannophilus NRRL Y-2460 TaxID=669874 RepID=A0A1E4U3P1_PACTA|nr:hypothetical protein PACTADRAFT_48341 [Pachysolen tannophilus NRRL Y-2460]
MDVEEPVIEDSGKSGNVAQVGVPLGEDKEEEVEEEEEDDEFNDNQESTINDGNNNNNINNNNNNNNNNNSNKGGDGINNLAGSRITIPELPELTRKDKTLQELLSMMDEYSPIIPDAVTDYLLAKNGLLTNDLQVKRLLALATQKFVSDIAQDAYEYSRIRSNTVSKLKNNLNNPNSGLQPPVSSQNANTGAMGTPSGPGGSGAGSNFGPGAGGPGGAGGSGAGASGGAGGFANSSTGTGAGGGSAVLTNEKVTLTMDDLSSALEEYGVNIKRPNFYR